MSNTSALNHWPTIITLEDCFVPELAQDVMDCATEATTETIATVIGLITLRAKRDFGVSYN